MSGWYKQLRNLSERPWYKDSCMVHLYHYLKERAYVADGTYEGIIIRRGSCPTTRSEMMEATGMKYMTLDRALRKLISYGEIVVKANSRFTVVTVCDYDSCVMPESLFRTTDEISNEITDEISNEITDEITDETTPNISNKKKEERYKEYLISPNSPYKNERETRDVVLEIKKRYNKVFDGKLPPLIRLHEPTRRMVEACISKFGLQSVDRVFDQVLAEPFSLGQNKTGFKASFQFIFEPRNFQQYLERAILAKRQKESEKSVGVYETPAAESPKTEEQKTEEQKQRLMALVERVKKNPTSLCKGALTAAWKAGTLQKLGIDWVPNEHNNP